MVLVIGLGLLTPVVMWGIQVRAASRLDPHIEELKMLRDRLSQELANARQSVQDADVQSKPRATASPSDGIRWSEVLRELSLTVPDGVWLSELEETPSPDKTTSVDGSVRLRGLASSQGGVAELMARLETSRRFATPTLVYTQQVGEQNHRIKFEIGCIVRRVSLGDKDPEYPA